MGIDTLGGRPAVFLDRDGVINRNVFNPATAAWESPLAPEQVELLPGVPEALLRLQNRGFLLFVVSNQPNVAKAKVSMETLNLIHLRLSNQLQELQVRIAAYYYCFHHPNGVTPGLSGVCACRKPSPFFLLKARDSFHLNMHHSWMVGDRASDVECGKSAGARTIRIINFAEQDVVPSDAIPTGDFVADSLSTASEIICSQSDATTSAAERHW